MAIYHLTVKVISRGKGRSAVGAASYRRGTRLYDERLEKTWNYENKEEVIHSEIIVPNDAPAWAKDLQELQHTDPDSASEILWNKVEQSEKRIDARLAREIEIAIPIEFNQEQAIQLVREFVTDQCVSLGMIADFSIHWDPGNPHVHIMLTTRHLTTDGFGKKNRDWNSVELVRTWRERWADYANFYLKYYKHDVKIDHRSYSDQGINLVPTVHLGRAVLDLAERGIDTDLLKEMRLIKAENLKRILADPSILLGKIESEQAIFSNEKIISELARYISLGYENELKPKPSFNDYTHSYPLPLGFNDRLYQSLPDEFKFIEDLYRIAYSSGVVTAIEALTADRLSAADIASQLTKKLKLIDGLARLAGKPGVAYEQKVTLVQITQQRLGIPDNAEQFEAWLKAYQAREGQQSSMLVAQTVTHSAYSEGGSSSHVNPTFINTSNNVEEPIVKHSTALRIADLLKELEHHHAVFGERDIAKILAAYTQDADDFARALIQIKASPDVLYLGVGDDGRDRYTTRRMFYLEAEIQTLADNLRDKKHQKISKTAIQQGIKQYQALTGKTLTQEQYRAVNHLVKNTSISCLVAPAGTGKSFLLDSARTLWEAHSMNVYGVALSGIAADGLVKDAGIKNSRTIESFLMALNKGSLILVPGDVVVMDEAGMTDSISMHSVLKAVHAAKAKLVLVGDPEQLQPVGPGASFRALVERIGFTTLETIYRQKTTWQREATVAFSSSLTIEGLTAYEQHHCIHLVENERLAQQQLVRDWLHTKETSGKTIDQLIVIAHRNEDVNTLNQLIRKGRIANNEIMEGYETASRNGKLLIAQGERLLFLKNDTRLGVNNGRFATVKHVEVSEAGRVLRVTVELDGSDKRTVTFDPSTYQDFAYGYASTVHKLQGTTFDHSFVYAQGYGWDQHLLYVAMSRHRETCHLYAAKTDYEDIEALKKRLSRLSIKDSVLDFPLSFALRRGFESQVFNHLPAHLTHRLQAIRAKLHDNYERLVNPTRYWQNKAEQMAEGERVRSLYEQREDAKHVAAYVDGNIDFGRAWQALSTKMKQLGLAHIDYKSPVYIFLKATPEYQAYLSTRYIRDALADKLYQEPDRYQKAFKIYGLSLDKLQKEALAYECHERVKAYQDAGSRLLKDKLAANIMQDIRHHYTQLHELGLDIKDLKAQSFQHERRILLKSLNPLEREAFYRVERYRAINQQVAGLMVKKGVDKVVLACLLKERGKLAYTIMQQQTLHEPGLDFYQIGSLKTDNHFEDAPRQAHARWYKMQQHAKRHDDYLTAERYQDAVNHGQVVVRDRLAAYLIEHRQDCWFVLQELGVDSRSLWKFATTHDRRKLLTTLDLTQRQAFYRVERYLKTSKQIAQLLQHKLKNLLKLNTLLQLRDSLAASIRDDLALHEAGLNFYEIGTIKNNNKFPDAARYGLARWYKLQQHATKYEKRLKLGQYLEANDVLYRSEIAQSIIHEADIYAGPVREFGIAWRDIYTDARVVENIERFKLATLEEKKALRLYKKYRKVSKQAGRAWSKIKAKQPITRIQYLQTAYILMAKRDRLAYQLQDSLDLITLQALFEERDVLSTFQWLNREKLAKQSQQHQDRISQINAWREVAEETKLQLASVNNPAHYVDWLANVDELEALAKPILRQPYLYQSAFADTQQSASGIHHFNQGISNIKATINELSENENLTAWQPEQQAKIARARKIERGTKLAKGTLAERYLRKHRGVKGDIPATFRFHPGLYHGEAGRKLPALVVITKGDDNQTQAVQVIFLDPKTAHKAKVTTPKLTYGILSQGHMGVLVNQGENNSTLYIAEGPETAISIKEAKPDATIYAVLGSSNFARVPIFDETKHIVFCADNDGANLASQQKLEKAAQHLAKKGITVWQVMPREAKQDFNDVLKQQGIEAIRDYLAKPVIVAKAQSKEVAQERLENQVAEITGQHKVPWQAWLQESKPLAGTLGEVYLREKCGLSVLPSQRVKFHPGIYESESNKPLPALVGEVLGPEQQIKGIQVIFLNPETGDKASIKQPVKYAGFNTGSVIPIQKGDFKQDKQLLIGFDMESSLALAQMNPKSTVLCARSLDGLQHFPFKGHEHEINLCLNEPYVLPSLQPLANELALKGFNVKASMPEKPQRIYEAWQENKSPNLTAKSLAEAVLPEMVNRMNAVEKQFNQLNKELYNASKQPLNALKVQSEAKLAEFATSITKEANLYKTINQHKPQLARQILKVVQTQTQGRGR